MFYAVRKGYERGIYGSWDEAKPLVTGYPGAEYKSFRALMDAEAYMCAGSTDKVVEQGADALYASCGCCAWMIGGTASGVAVRCDGSSVAQELSSVLCGLHLCGRRDLVIHTRYNGCKAWNSGSWMCRTELSAGYVDAMRELGYGQDAVFSVELPPAVYSFMRRLRKETIVREEHLPCGFTVWRSEVVRCAMKI